MWGISKILNRCRSAKDKKILREPSPISNQTGPSVVVVDKTDGREFVDPVFSRLFIEVADPSLSRMSSRHHNVVGVLGQTGKEGVSKVRMDMFRDLKAPDKVEFTSKVKRHVEVVTLNSLRIKCVSNSDLRTFDP